jgi:MFS family permease
VKTQQVAGAGAITMVSLCFANALQQGVDQSQSQAIESLKAYFHVTDTWIGLMRIPTGVGGALGALLIARLCQRRARTRVLAGMFAVWSVLMLAVGFAGIFFVFLLLRTMTAPTEATDPAALPLIADWWPAEQRAAKVSIFQAGAGVGAFVGLVGSGVLVDAFGWQACYWMWVPFGVIGAVLIWSRQEPKRGARDVAFRATVAELEGATLEEYERSAVAVPMRTGFDAWREVFALRSWRQAAFGIGVAQIFLTGLSVWGDSYFKRTFDLTGSDVAALAPIVGSGAFVGLLLGGFLADRLLRRGVLRARVHVTVFGYFLGGIVLAVAFLTTRLAVALPLLFVGTTLTALPAGPSYALLLDVTPVHLRERASGMSNVVMAVSLLGSPIVGGLSDLFDENLRLALLCVTPLYLVGALLIAMCLRTYGDDLAMVVAEAETME